MGLFYRLNLKKNIKEYSKNESVPVIVIYNFNYKKIKISTGISVKIKDWDNDWRKKLSKDPIKNSDEDSKSKNIIKGKLSEVRNIVERLVKEDKIPTTEIVKSLVREKKVQRVRKTLKEVHFLILFEKYETLWFIDITLNNLIRNKDLHTQILSQNKWVFKEYLMN